jgi:hypothetical protein
MPRCVGCGEWVNNLVEGCLQCGKIPKTQGSRNTTSPIIRPDITNKQPTGVEGDSDLNQSLRRIADNSDSIRVLLFIQVIVYPILGFLLIIASF